MKWYYWIIIYVAELLFTISPLPFAYLLSQINPSDAAISIFLIYTVPFGILIILITSAVNLLWAFISFNRTQSKKQLLIDITPIISIMFFLLFLRHQIYISDRPEYDPNNPDSLKAVMFWAIQKGDADELGKIIKLGGDIEAQSFSKATPALMAARKGEWEICLSLLKQGARIDVVDGAGFTIPYLALNDLDNVSLDKEDSDSVKEVWQLVKDSNIEHWSKLSTLKVKEIVEAGQWPPADY